MKNYLIVSALGDDQPGLVSEMSRAVLDCGCAIVDSRMTVLGGEFTLMMMVQGNWNTLAKLEMQLQRLRNAQDLNIAFKRSEGHRPRNELLPYGVEVIAMDQPGIVHGLASFFASRAINIQDMVTRRYNAPHTETTMFAVNMVIGVPATTHIALLREEFMDFCDELNLDAVLEPVKG